ncbi:calcium-binding protein [Methylocucumis oryzae]|uniref:Haemolysin-type calcium binding-related domain-containing protein n=1 Tax=Methylocucumis oryzae TaxID=1632867 RepID=A0A0F3IJB6_9GAMM|nr:calcium-binding protein [Methylocucumis oryzae]KJV06801.1 hypothetical protein VZ94_08975 [Methylocucumis oryzae]
MGGFIMPNNGTDQEMTLDALIASMGYKRFFVVLHPAYGMNTPDYDSRSYIYGHESFAIAKGAKFIVKADGTRYIEDYAILPANEDFDYVTQSGQWLQQWADGTFLEDKIDPSGIGKTVLLKFDDDVKNAYVSTHKVIYMASQFEQDYRNNKDSNVPEIVGLTNFTLGTYSLTQDLFDSGVTKFLDADGKPILYGSDQNDSITGTESRTHVDIAKLGFYDDYIENGIHYIGGGGNDQLVGTEYKDKLFGGGDNDKLNGGKDNDTLKGGEGNDILEGGAEDDNLDGGEGSDALEGGSGYDIYQVGTGDRIIDTDGKGHVWQGSMQFRGGDYVSPNLWKDNQGNTYSLMGDTLMIYDLKGTGIIIYQFKNHDLEIDLADPKDNGGGSGGSDGFGGGTTDSSPIVLDLDRNGIITTDLKTGTFFDHGNDGFAEQTGWVSPKDGLLALDRDGNGLIDSGRELFGSNTLLNNGQAAANGYEALAEFDSNHDGKIDVQDPVYSQLTLWQDQNGDGESQAHELLGLAQASVQSIAVTYLSSGLIDNGNAIKQISSFTWNDGSSNQTADVWFKSNEFETIPKLLLPETPDIAVLPNVTGFRTIYDLHQSMLRDGSGELQALVQAFVNAPAEARRGLVDTIIFTWLGVDDIAINSRGSNIDARELAVLELFAGKPFYSTFFHSSDPGLGAGLRLEALYTHMADIVYQQLMDSYFTPLLNDVVFMWNGDTQQFDTDVTANLVSGLASLYSQGEPGIANINEFITTLKNHGELGEQALVSLLAYSDLSYELYVLLGANHPYAGTPNDDRLYGRVNADKMYGREGNDKIETYAGDDMLMGGTGNDTLEGGEDDDTLIGGADNDSLYGGAGNDVYWYNLGDGQEVIYEAESQTDQDIIQFGVTINSSDLIWSRNNNDLIIRFKQTVSDQITLQGFFNSSNQTTFNRFQFADNTFLDATTIKAQLLIGGSGNENLEGYNNSNDVLSGLGGNDTLSGQGGSDTYIFEPGWGQDSILNYDLSVGKVDRVQFGVGISPSDIQFSRSDDEFGTSNDLILSRVGSTDTITLQKYGNEGHYTLELIRFADGTEWDVAYIKHQLLVPTNGNDSLRGFIADDVIYGLAGSDTLGGTDGNDVLFGDQGDDALYGDGSGYHGIGNQVFLNGGVGNDYLSFEMIHSNGSEAAVLVGGKGNDQFTTVSNFTFYFERGDGSDVINIKPTFYSLKNKDTIVLGPGITPSDVHVCQIGAKGFWLDLGGGDQIKWLEQQNSIVASVEQTTLQLLFSDDTLWDRAEIIRHLSIFSSADADNLYGTVNADVIHASDGADYIDGIAGNDSLSGVAGNDTLYGNEGNDQLLGDSGDDSLFGGMGDDTLRGGANNDYIDGSLGNDLIEGGVGNDYLYGRSGSDSYLFGRGSGQDSIGDAKT